MHLFALSHVGGLLVAFTLFSTIPMWHHYAAESPGAHWKYEGANGPEWWGSIKVRLTSTCSLATHFIIQI